MDGGVLFKGITFSGHFFEMIILQLAAGGTGAPSAKRSIKVKWSCCSQVHLSTRFQFLAAAVSFVSGLISTFGKRRGHRGCHCDKFISSSRSQTKNLCSYDQMIWGSLCCWVFSQLWLCISNPSWFFSFLNNNLCACRPVKGTQLCVITSVIKLGYGPPATQWTLYPI